MIGDYSTIIGDAIPSPILVTPHIYGAVCVWLHPRLFRLTPGLWWLLWIITDVGIHIPFQADGFGDWMDLSI